MRKLIIFLILTTFNCSDKETVSFYSTTRHIFFDADIKKYKQGLTDFFDDCKYFDKPTGYTTYPSLDPLGDSEDRDNSYRFKTHPFLPFLFKNGSIRTHKVREELHFPPMLRLVFETKGQADSAFKYLSDMYIRLSTRHNETFQNGIQFAEFFDDNSTTIKKINISMREGTLGDPYVILFNFDNNFDKNDN